MSVSTLLPFVLAMGLVIAVSNVLVQYPLGNWLTYGALTYPVAFLVTDLVTRLRGASAAQRVIGTGVVIGITCSAVAALFGLTTARIAIASAVAFLVAQLVDVKLFVRLRQLAWWQTPVISSIVGSLLDTFIFFGVAFSALTLSVLPDANTWALEAVPLLGIGPVFPLWVSLALADLVIKLVVLPILLVPYRWLTHK